MCQATEAHVTHAPPQEKQPQGESHALQQRPSTAEKKKNVIATHDQKWKCDGRRV